MNKLTKKLTQGLMASVMMISVLALAGCGSGSSSGDANTKSNAKEYIVATNGTFRPFTYTDDKGNLTGYDVEILKEVERRNPDIKFTFKVMSVDAGFLAMEAGQVDIIANQIVYNEKRIAKTIYTKEINNYTARKLAVREDNNEITTIDDLRGKKVAVTAASEVTRQLQKYNETANPPIEFVFSDKGASELMNLVATGRADATPQYEVAIAEAIKVLGLKLKAVGPVIASDPTNFALPKNEDHQALADRLDKTVKEMRDDGTLKKLSEQYLGKDYTVPQK